MLFNEVFSFLKEVLSNLLRRNHIGGEIEESKIIKLQIFSPNTFIADSFLSTIKYFFIEISTFMKFEPNHLLAFVLKKYFQRWALRIVNKLLPLINSFEPKHLSSVLFH